MFIAPAPLWAFVALLAVHWIGDFFLQSHWMSVNKSKRNDALALHVGVYSSVLLLASAVIFGPSAAVVFFGLLNAALHFATDYLTSRWSSRLWGEAFNAPHGLTHYPPKDKPIHNFFVVIGIDQYIHQFTLAATMWWLLT